MNLIENKLKTIIIEAIDKTFSYQVNMDDVVIEIPKDKLHGDYATNIAMRLAKQLKQKPMDIANALLPMFLNNSDFITNVEIAGPGFINFTLCNERLADIITVVLKAQDDYGRSDSGKHVRVNLEYVSANPTGDLHPGHARGAAMGDSVARLMRFAGFDVTSEYYVNDAGNQINNMALSLQARYFQRCGVDTPIPDDGYNGPDLIAIADKLYLEEGSKYLSIDKEESLPFFRSYGLQEELNKLKSDLELFRVKYDVWTSEQSIYDRDLVAKVVQKLKDADMTYEFEDALWLKTTLFGDDKDRVIVRSNGLYTYLTPDIAYHIDKFERGFDRLVDFLGADHHGYINRLKAGVLALGYNKDQIEIDIIQMARMIKDGAEFKMSKRTGKAVALKDLIEEAGVDAVRYYFANRAADTHMDFDLDMAVKQANDNPVYYAQYAHARVCSILRSGKDYPTASFYDGLNHPKEIDLLKHINEFPVVVSDAAITRQPHKICNYIQKLASMFHSFYGECKVLDEDNVVLSQQRLALVSAVKITLKNALNLIGVDAPERM
ncbi:MAG: arginine--tRNA ligase [Erysipelotrichaceae bacterium]|nr:arginine--tRNA ligase [Erysipelotrichaceae bacterium]